VTLLTLAELAARLRVSRRTAHRIATGEMVHVRARRQILVPEVEFERWIRRRMQAPSEASTDEGKRGGGWTAKGDGSAIASWLRPITVRTRKPSKPR
jgi:excisionase family DNA binding protein